MPKAGVPSNEPGVKEKQPFLSIPLACLQVDTVMGFDIYLKQGEDKPPVLYRQKDLPFTAAARERLVRGNATEVQVPLEQRAQCQLYIEKLLPVILADPKVPMQEKAEVLYTSTRNLMEEVMADPRSGEAIARSKNVVKATIDFATNNKASFEHLVKVLSYDYYTFTHGVNVLVFSTALAERVGFSRTDLSDFGEGALLHDVGKSMIDPAIINAHGKLTPSQWEQIKQHPVHSHNILAEHGNVPDVALDVCRHHHEKMSGNGYPDGLRKEAISRFARIAAIADIFDALTTRRSYKAAIHSFPALRLMREDMAQDLDQELLSSFINMMGNPSG